MCVHIRHQLGRCPVSVVSLLSLTHNQVPELADNVSRYPWKSAAVITTMVVGGVTLFGILPAYEIWVHKRGKEPYLPLHLFKNIRFKSAAWNTGISAGVYY